MLNRIMNGYTWTQKRRVSEFILHDFDKWAAQNDAECIDFAEGCLLDNLVMNCKRGTAFLFEEYQNEWTSRYHVYFVPYKEQENNPEYNALWERFERLHDMEEEG